MPPKRGRSAPGAPSWEAGLTGAQFEEPSWRACLSLLAGGTPADEELMEALQLAVQQPQRRLFTLLSHEAVVAMIHDLGTPKAKKPKDVPLYSEVTESAKVLLDAGEDIPCELMAYILKFRLLQVKASDQQRRVAMQGSEEKVHSRAGPASATKHKPSDNKAQKATAPESVATVKQTKLKRRGEGVQTPEYIDDEPENGPQHYILLTGFYQAQLLPALQALGVRVDNVIKVEWESGNHGNRCLPEGRDSVVSGECKAKQQGVFWWALGGLLDRGPACSKLCDVARLSYTAADPSDDPGPTLALGSHVFEGVACLIYDCLDWRRQHQNYLDHMSLITIPTVIDESLQSSEQEDAPGVLSRDVDMRYYDNLMDQFPPEACSVPLILHCMLEQVVKFPPENGGSVAGPELDPGPAGIRGGLARCMLENLQPLARTEEERRRLLDAVLTVAPDPDQPDPGQQHSERSAVQQSPDQMLVFRHRDERALRLHLVTAPLGLDPVLVEGAMLQLSPLWRLIGSDGSAAQRGSSIADTSMQQVLHYCTSEEASMSTVEHMLHQRVLERIPISAVDQQGALKRNDPLATVERQPHHSHDQTYLSQEPDNQENTLSLLDKLDIFQRSQLRSLSEYRYVEHHDTNVFPQVLQSAVDSSLCMDSFHSPLDHTLYIICHSPRSAQRHCSESWDTALHTDVAFRKYQEHVAHVISDWTREMEAKREAKEMMNPTLLESQHDTASAAEQTAQEPDIREESLKAWKLHQEQCQQEAELCKKGKDSTAKRGPSATAGDREDKNPLARAKKQETPGSPTTAPPGGRDQRGQTPGSPTTASPGGQGQRGQPTVDFHGYRMGGELIHVSGHLQHLFPSDGGLVTVEKLSFVHGSSLIKVAVKKDGHHFYTHRVAMEPEQTPLQGEDIRGPGRDAETSTLPNVQHAPPDTRGVKPQGSFSAVLDDGVRLSFCYEGPAGEHTVCPQEVTQDNVSPAAPCSPRGLNLPASPKSAEERSPSCPFNSLHVSVPNGLTLQFLEDTHGATHGERRVLVRQYSHDRRDGVAVAMPAELSRVITSQGAVVRHLRGGSTEVLFPDGAVSFSPDSGPVWPLTTEPSQGEPDDAETDALPPPGRGHWITTAPSGARVYTVGSTHEHRPISSVLSVHATDPFSKAVMVTRQDRVVCVQDTDGTLTVEHADGTRISSFCQGKATSPTHRHTGGRGPSWVSGDPVAEEEEATAERVVLVEREGLAGVMVFPERGAAHVFLEGGTVATGEGGGVYQVFPASTGRLLIGQDGLCVYNSDPTPSSLGSQSGSYRLSATDRVTCDITDPEGNHFQVKQTGQVSVVLSSAPRTPGEPDDVVWGDVHTGHGEHSPRLVYCCSCCARTARVPNCCSVRRWSASSSRPSLIPGSPCWPRPMHKVSRLSPY